MSEKKLQIELVKEIRTRGIPGLMYWAIPNGMYAGGYARGVSVMKAMGMIPGASDMMFFYQGRLYCLELKSETGGKPTDLQEEFEQGMALQGAWCAVCWGLRSAITQLEAWGLLKANRAVIEAEAA